MSEQKPADYQKAIRDFKAACAPQCATEAILMLDAIAVEMNRLQSTCHEQFDRIAEYDRRIVAVGGVAINSVSREHHKSEIDSLHGTYADIHKYADDKVKNLQARITELEQQLSAQESAWRPIETIPREKFVDLWVDMPNTLAGGARITNCALLENGNWSGRIREYLFGVERGYSTITHWMPLPASPTSEGG